MYISIPKNSKIKSNVELHKLINIDIGRINFFIQKNVLNNHLIDDY